MYPHRIRLRGPWECEPTGQPPRRLTLPCTADEANLSGGVRLRRRFGYPGHIDAHERVWLVIEGLPGPARLDVNGTALHAAAAGDHEFDITALLCPRNELTVDLHAGGGLWREAALEVRCLAYLRGVAAEVRGGVACVRGEVVGPPEPDLELYLIAGRSPAGYRPVTPAPEGQPFELAAPADAATPLRIELVRGGVVWYSTEVPCDAG